MAESLQKDNCDEWQEEVDELLKGVEDLDYATPEIMSWELSLFGLDFQNAIRKAGRSRAISPLEQSYLAESPTAREVWNTLQNSCEPPRSLYTKMLLLKKLFCHKMKDWDTMMDYLSNFFEILQALKDMKIDLDNEVVTLLMLHGLADPYNYLRSRVEARSRGYPLPSPEKVAVQLEFEYNLEKWKEVRDSLSQTLSSDYVDEDDFESDDSG